jgi:glycosyltransferase involved in cell wall biosynthesis
MPTKLIIQIPCYNEEQTLGITLSQLPRKVVGVDIVEWLIMDDGSTDGTVDIAVAHGVDHVVRHTTNKGLARAFMTGLIASLEFGADIIVNTDADNQYCADDIPKLIEPIVSGRAEMVVGERPIMEIGHFSLPKKILQRIGSLIVRIASKTQVPDAPCGFRAISRKAAKQLNVFTRYTYTIETIIQAGQKGITVTSVPIRVNRDTRPSRLIKNIPSYLFQSIVTIIRIVIIYRPLRFFLTIGALLFSAGFLVGARFLYLRLIGEGAGHTQSLILAAILLLMGFQVGLFGLFADLISVNRRLLEDIQSYSREQQWTHDKKTKK